MKKILGPILATAISIAPGCVIEEQPPDTNQEFPDQTPRGETIPPAGGGGQNNAPPGTPDNTPNTPNQPNAGMSPQQIINEVNRHQETALSNPVFLESYALNHRFPSNQFQAITRHLGTISSNSGTVCRAGYRDNGSFILAVCLGFNNNNGSYEEMSAIELDERRHIVTFEFTGNPNSPTQTTVVHFHEFTAGQFEDCDIDNSPIQNLQCQSIMNRTVGNLQRVFNFANNN